LELKLRIRREKQDRLDRLAKEQKELELKEKEFEFQERKFQKELELQEKELESERELKEIELELERELKEKERELQEKKVQKELELQEKKITLEHEVQKTASECSSNNGDGSQELDRYKQRLNDHQDADEYFTLHLQIMQEGKCGRRKRGSVEYPNAY
jgi:hypothetical protein